MRRFTITGQDNWNPRTGYRHGPRVPGPLERTPPINPALWLAITSTAVSVALVGWAITLIIGD